MPETYIYEWLFQLDDFQQIFIYIGNSCFAIFHTLNLKHGCVGFQDYLPQLVSWILDGTTSIPNWGQFSTRQTRTVVQKLRYVRGGSWEYCPHRVITRLPSCDLDHMERIDGATPMYWLLSWPHGTNSPFGSCLNRHLRTHD